MSATQWEHVIQIPDTHTFEGETSGGVPDDPADEPSIRWWCVLALIVAAVFALLITLEVLDGPSQAYSAAITGAVAAASSSKASPFNLTVHMENPSRLCEHCVSTDTTTTVSYHGANIGVGILPMLYAGKRDENEVVVPVYWAVGAAVTLQRREAVVDVVIRMPRGPDCKSSPQVLTCSVRVGGGLSPCTSYCNNGSGR